MLYLVVQSCPSLCDPMDCSPPGFSVRGILQAGILEWVAMPSSRGSSNPGIKPRSPALQADSLLSEPSGKPLANKNVELSGPVGFLQEVLDSGIL